MGIVRRKTEQNQIDDIIWVEIRRKGFSCMLSIDLNERTVNYGHD